MQGLLTRWRAVDALLYRIESGAVVVATAVMTLSVFLSILWELFAASDSHCLPLVHAVWADAPAWVADWCAALLWSALCVLGMLRAKPAWRRLHALVAGIGLAASVIAAGRGLVWLLPEGIVFSQRLALSLFMWVVLLGVSMAAHKRRHLAVQAIQRAIAPDRQRAHGALVLAIAGLFTLFLTFESARYCWTTFSVWLQSDGQAGVLESLPIPVFLVTLAIPVGFLLTGVRFLVQSVLIARQELVPYAVDAELDLAGEA
jgi:TRAP-type C4-dicarboxylate transport system permease small subunit